MSDPRLADLLAIPRGAAARDHRWAAVEGELGLQLPGSYKAGRADRARPCPSEFASTPDECRFGGWPYDYPWTASLVLGEAI